MPANPLLRPVVYLRGCAVFSLSSMSVPTPQVDIFIPCFVDQLYPHTALNMVRVLEKVGCQVQYNPDQTCCGQPAYNAGYKAESRDIARKFLADFPTPAAPRYVVSPSASCVGMVRTAYPLLFADTPDAARCQALRPRVYELTEFLVDVLGISTIPGAALAGTYTYHDSCAALRECGIREAPRRLLDAVAGLTPPRDGRNHHLLRLWRHVRREVRGHFGGDGPAKSGARPGHRGRLYHQHRRKLPHAPGGVHPPRKAGYQDATHRGCAGEWLVNSY